MSGKCDDYCSNYGCNKGDNCPARITNAQPTPFSPAAKPSRLEPAIHWGCIVTVLVVAVVIAVSAVVYPGLTP